MPHRAPRFRLPGSARRASLRVLTLIAVVSLAAGPFALTGSAAGALTMNARVLLQGHARAGSWAAVQVDLQNDGPGIRGELRIDGGSQANARFAMAVDLPTSSRQTYVLHVQPPAFARTVKVDLVTGDQVIDSVSVAYLVHDATQLVVGVLAERPQALVSQIKLPANLLGAAAAVIPLTVADLPERAEGWDALDRLVWQDIDSNQLSRPFRIGTDGSSVVIARVASSGADRVCLSGRPRKSHHPGCCNRIDSAAKRSAAIAYSTVNSPAATTSSGPTTRSSTCPPGVGSIAPPV